MSSPVPNGLVRSVGKPEIRNHEIGFARTGLNGAVLRVRGFTHLEAFPLERSSHEPTDLTVVLHEQDPGRDIYGRSARLSRRAGRFRSRSEAARRRGA